VVYTLTWILETVGLVVFWQLPGPAVCGYVAMGVLVALAWQSYQKTTDESNSAAEDAKAAEP